MNIGPITSRDVKRWHDYKFVPETSSYRGMIILRDDEDQFGGAPEFEEFIVDGKSYTFKINLVRADHMEVHDDEVV